MVNVGVRKFDEKGCRIADELRGEGVSCTCDLDAWEPELKTGHVRECMIHKIALLRLAKLEHREDKSDG